MSDVTVVIATRDRAALAHAWDRLTGLPDRAEIIVVDNGSTDGTPDVVRRYFPGVRLLALRTNRGAGARNLGVRAARTPYVAFADDDSWWRAGSLARAGAVFDRYPRLAVLAARTLVGPRERVDPMSTFMATAPLGWPDDLPGPAVLGFLACAAVVRRSAFLDCGGFDPVVFFMGEEARVAYDLAAAGWGLAYCPEVVAHHHPVPGGDGTGKRLLATRNAALTAWMRRPLPVAWAHTEAVWKAGATAGFATRLPRAVARRRPPHPAVEAALTRLAAAEQAVGYRTIPVPALV